MGKRIQQVDDYITNVSEQKREIVMQLRDMLHAEHPQLDETFEYNMPSFEYNGMVCSLAARKNYISLYCNTEVVEKYREELGKLSVGKSCIRFRKLEDLPMETIHTIIDESIAINETLPTND